MPSAFQCRAVAGAWRPLAGTAIVGLPLARAGRPAVVPADRYRLGGIFERDILEQDIAHFTRRVVPGFDLHRRVATKGAVAEDNARNMAMAAIAVWDRANAGPMAVGEVHVFY